MKPKEKIRVAVLYGGRSAEHEVSLRSAANVMNNLDPAHFDIVPIGIDKQGSWFLGKDVFAKSLEHNQVPKLQQEWFTAEWVGKPVENPQVNGVVTATMPRGNAFDVVIPAVHGTLCEDGTLQGLLELADLPYVGCGVLSSAIGMDKDVSKRLAQCAGINVAPFITIKHDEWQSAAAAVRKKIAEKISYPLFTKPANTGSSIGINKVKSPDQLDAALNEAFRFDTKVVVEKALNVQELEIAVLESLEPNTPPIVSVVGEVNPSHEFYSYDAKYVDEKGAELLIPTLLSSQIQEDAKKMAIQLFEILECEGMARVDLFYDKDSKQIYFNEINTLPGFTQISMYPKLMEATGISYSKLLTHLVELAMKRHANKKKLSRNYTD